MSNGTFTAYAVQFLRPSGHKSEVSTELPIELKQQYDLMMSSGCRFETELLSTGLVSTTIADAEQDHFHKITPNGPQVKDAVIAMLKDFDPSKLQIETITE